MKNTSFLRVRNKYVIFRILFIKMHNFDTVIIDKLVKLSPECANTLLRLNKTTNKQIMCNKSLISYLVQHFKTNAETLIDEQLKRAFHIYNQPSKIVGIVNTKKNDYNIWFNGYFLHHVLIISESSKNSIERLTKIKEDYIKIIQFENKQNNTSSKSNPVVDMLNDFLLSIPVNNKDLTGEIDYYDFLSQFTLALMMFVIGSITENRLGDHWFFAYIIVIITLLITLSYYHLYIKNRNIDFF